MHASKRVQRAPDLLERRLDNVVSLAGFAPTIAVARLTHRQVLHNGKRASIPSMRFKAGDALTLKGRRLQLPLVLETMKDIPMNRPEWLGWDIQTRRAKAMHLPTAENVPFPVDVQ